MVAQDFSTLATLVTEKNAMIAERDAALAKPLERILMLANGLSTRLKGTPEMYEANKIMHEVWAIQGALAPHAAPTKKTSNE